MAPSARPADQAVRVGPGGNWQFRPGPFFTAACAVALAILVGLGTWQLQRRDAKEAHIAKIEAGLALPPVAFDPMADPSVQDFRRLQTAGRLLPDRAFMLGSRVRGEQLGSDLVAPLLLADGSFQLVELGWLDDAEFAAWRAGTPARDIRLVGVGRDRSRSRPGFFVPNARPAQRRWYDWDLASVARDLGGKVQPIVVTAERLPEGVSGPVPRPVSVDLPNDHLNYVITWFGLAGGLVMVWALRGIGQRETDR